MQPSKRVVQLQAWRDGKAHACHSSVLARHKCSLVRYFHLLLMLWAHAELQVFASCRDCSFVSCTMCIFVVFIQWLQGPSRGLLIRSYSHIHSELIMPWGKIGVQYFGNSYRNCVCSISLVSDFSC